MAKLKSVNHSALNVAQRKFYSTYGPSLSADGANIAYLYDDGTGYASAYQRPVPSLGEKPQEPRQVRLPVVGPITSVEYSPDGDFLAVEVSPLARSRNEVWVVTNNPDDDRAWRISHDDDVEASLIGWKDHMVTMTAHNPDYEMVTRAVDPFTGAEEILDRQHNAVLLDASGTGADSIVLLRCGERGQRYPVLRFRGRDYELLVRAKDSSTEDGRIIPAQTVVEDPHDVDASTVITILLASEYGAEAMRLLQVTLVIPHDADTYRITTTDIATRPGCELDEFTISHDGQVVAALWNTRGYSEADIVSLADDTVTSLNIPHSTVLSTPALCGDGTQLALTVESPDIAPHILMCNTRTGQAIALDKGGPDLLPSRLPQLHSFRARDGLRLEGWWYPPHEVAVPHAEDTAYDADPASNNAAAGSKGVILWFHGGPEWESRPTWIHIIPILRAAGYGVFTPNVRGSTGYGRVFNHLDDGDKRTDSWNDMIDSANYARENLSGAQERLIVSGRSYGGYLTNVAVAKYPGVFDAAIAVCGMSDIANFLETTEPWMAERSYSKYGRPGVDDELFAAISPLRHLDGALTPLLCVHGSEDNNVPPSESRNMVEALQARGVPAELLLIEGEGHEIATRAANVTLAHAMLDWIDEHAPTPTNTDHT